MPAVRRLPSTPIGLAIGAAALGVGFAALMAARSEVNTATPALVLVLPGVAAALFGGRIAAACVALASAAAFDLAFLPPYGTWKIFDPADVTAVIVFLLVALAVAELTARESQGRRDAEHRAEELQEITVQLQREQHERNRLVGEVDRLAVMAEVDIQRSALLRSVSHDLRTPLATIRAVSSDLQDDADHDEGTRRELLALVSDEAERLDRLVGNLLSMSRIEAGSFAPARSAVDVEDLVAPAVARLRRVVVDHRVEIGLEPGLPFVHADHTQLDLVVSNLIENAARHATPRSTIRVAARQIGAMVEISVENQGTGVLATERARIFEVFHRSHGSRSSGVGLAICKAVVDGHGGSIRVDDVAGGGARFAFTVPIAPTRSTSTMPSREQSG